MRSTVSTVAAALTAVAVLVLGAHAWGDPQDNSLAAPASPSPTATSPQPLPAPPTTPALELPEPVTPPPAAADGVDVVTVESPEGYHIVTGTGPQYGNPSAPLRWYTVEAHPDLRDELPTVLAVTDVAFNDTNHGWTARGERSLQRTDDPNLAAIRIVLAPAGVVDAQCARAGLNTVGYYSCWNGQHAMLNADRWFGATPDFADLNVYRLYLVNHEFGHGLGYGHEYCPAAGAPAPVMAQQSMGLGACLPNGLPYP